MGRLIGRFRRGPRPDDETRDASGGTDAPGVFTEPSAKGFGEITYPEEHGITPDPDEKATVRPSSRDITEGFGEEDRERAVAALRDFLAQNATNLDRASRLRARAERLEREGIPSDSAYNRARRAREEIVEGLARLRHSLSGAGEAGPALALDSEVIRLDPPISPGEIRG